MSNWAYPSVCVYVSTAQPFYSAWGNWHFTGWVKNIRKPRPSFKMLNFRTMSTKLNFPEKCIEKFHMIRSFSTPVAPFLVWSQWFPTTKVFLIFPVLHLRNRRGQPHSLGWWMNIIITLMFCEKFVELPQAPHGLTCSPATPFDRLYINQSIPGHEIHCPIASHRYRLTVVWWEAFAELARGTYLAAQLINRT